MTIWHGLRSALIGFSGDSGGYPQAGDLSPGADGCKTALSLWRGGFGMLGSTGGETFQVIAAKDNALGLGEKVQIVRCIISDWVTVTECRCETGGVCWRGGLVVSRGSGVYIRFFGNGGLWFRPYGGSLWKSPKVTKGLLPHHSAPRLGSVCPNAGLNPWAAVMGHPWPRTANPASCRVAHGFKPAFGQRGLTGRLRSKSKSKSKSKQQQSKRRAAAAFRCLDCFRTVLRQSCSAATLACRLHGKYPAGIPAMCGYPVGRSGRHPIGSRCRTARWIGCRVSVR